MKGFIWFAPDFCDWPLGIIEHINKLYPDSKFSGIVTAGDYYFNRVIDKSKIDIEPLYNLDSLEKLWLEGESHNKDLNYYQNIFGPDFINNLIIADRQIGNGYITCGTQPETPLTRICSKEDKRYNYLSGMLNYLFKTFEKSDYDFVFGAGIASAFSLALVSVCKYFRIPYRYLLEIRMSNRYLISDGSDYYGVWVERLFKESLDNDNLLAKYYDDTQTIINKYRTNPEVPDYAKIIKSRTTKLLPFIDLAALLWRVIVRRAPESLSLPYPYAHLKYELQRYFKMQLHLRGMHYENINRIKHQSFVFYPLHVDPEASTMVKAPMYTNQLAVIEAISKSIPCGWKLLVKEHIPMMGRRPIGFYNSLKRIPKVVLVSPLESSFDLIKKAKITCVITGTVGLEAIILKRPLVCIGSAQYQLINKGFIYCDDLTQLSKAFNDALSLKPVDDEYLIKYIASLLKLSFEFPYDLMWGSVTPEKVAKNTKLIEKVINNLLDTL